MRVCHTTNSGTANLRGANVMESAPTAEAMPELVKDKAVEANAETTKAEADKGTHACMS